MEHIYPFDSEPEACRCALWLKLWADEPEVFMYERVKLTPEDFEAVNDAKAVSKVPTKVA